MKELRNASEVRSYIHVNHGKQVGLVPTMGCLHEGHTWLMKKSMEENDVTIVSIFVNPTQFGPGEDLESYPRSEESDIKICGDVGCDAVFVPAVEEVYGSEFGTWVETEVGRADRNANSEGAYRPTFFRGVATVVTKLMCLVRPDRIYFGQKDVQQAAVVKRLTEDLWLGSSVRVCETVREEDGLAMSSRNKYLTGKQRGVAGALWRGMQVGRGIVEEAIKEGRKEGVQAKEVRQIVENHIEKEWEGMDSAEVVYVSVCDRSNLYEVGGVVEKGNVLCVAAKLGRARLIDNVLL